MTNLFLGLGRDEFESAGDGLLVYRRVVGASNVLVILVVLKKMGPITTLFSPIENQGKIYLELKKQAWLVGG